MTAPVIRQFTGTIPDKGQSQTAFDTNVDAFLDWQALQFAPDLVAFGTFANDTAAALVAANLPSLTGRALDAVRVNAAADDVEFADVTAAGWALLDDADAAAQRTTLGAASIASVESKASIASVESKASIESVESKASIESVALKASKASVALKASIASVALKAPIESPQLTGTPSAPTASATTNTTQLATTAYTRIAIPDMLNAVGSASMYACRAWVNFNGTGTPSIRGGGNVSSITDNGTGDYTLNFTKVMHDTNYSVQITLDHNNSDRYFYQPTRVNRSVSSYRFKQTYDGGGFGEGLDSESCNVAIFR